MINSKTTRLLALTTLGIRQTRLILFRLRTGLARLPHHRRTPFAVAPDGTTGYLAYLNADQTSVLVQQVDTTSFTSVGDAVTITGTEAGGLVAHDDGFAVLIKTTATGSENLPTDDMPIAVVVRYTDGGLSWSTELNGPSSYGAGSIGRTATPDINGDLVWSESAGLYGAYYVVTAYDGDASGHYGDAISYVDASGTRQDSTEGTNTWGCSHNTGIGFEAADAAPFASVCAEDQGAIWLNTNNRGMDNVGQKISNENTTNGSGGEAMYGMSGSYSNLARFSTSDSYIFAWQSRGATDLTLNEWMGDGYTACSPRWLNHNVAIAIASDKETLSGDQATSEVGATDGDAQITWVTEDDGSDHQNIHVEAFDGSNALVTYETLSNPTCEPLPLSCTGTFSGTSFQVVSSSGELIGSPVVDDSITVSGDIALLGDGRLCWPYVKQTWDLSAAKDSGTPTSTMSFACASLNRTANSNSTSSESTATETSVATTSVDTLVNIASSTAVAETSAAEAASSSVLSVTDVPQSTVVSQPVVTETTASTTATGGVWPTGSWGSWNPWGLMLS
ncbi:related to Similarity to glucan 1,4-alpha-glucosidase Sta1p and YAR066w [Armillaria ostoyae]|uniref:Related to Similarity to glucan 1,4-alpha-glucosidase Sta1p and YAR066w n=1 Tax=Armillaria ostoyae TaxID=47428 RepID=A0A284RYJ9_ARMOS|nr:related to Similarity to glucan 1,4-alpha-glucosidase Sta1p and YAR066w [Armillaria ostoyae]